MSKNIDKIKVRIEKLLAQAHDQEGTPEGDVFQAKAFELLARYGLSEADVASDDTDMSEVVYKVIDITGSYRKQQTTLLGNLAVALHGQVVIKPGHTQMHVFAAKRHMERIMLLWPILNAMMAAGASEHKTSEATPWLTTRQVRLSWMIGFIGGIRERLAAAEENVAEETGTGTEIMLRDDAARALGERDKMFPILRKGTGTTVRSGEHLAAGREAANGADLGQTRVTSRAALTA